MKELLPQRKTFNRPTIGFIAIAAVALYAYLNELLTMGLLTVFIIGLSFFNYATSIALYHYFLYTKESVTVRNKWWPFINDVYYLADIKDVELIVQTNVGFSILFYFKNGKKKVYGIQANKEDIDEMITFIHAEIEKRE